MTKIIIKLTHKQLSLITNSLAEITLQQTNPKRPTNWWIKKYGKSCHNLYNKLSKIEDELDEHD